MSIEKDIYQFKFRNEQQKAMINIIYTYHWIQERVKKLLDEHDLTPQQFNILRILRGAKDPLSTLQIRERMLDKMSDTSRLVDRLQLKGLVKKNTCPHDKRLVDVVISDDGLAMLEKLDACNHRFDNVMANLSDGEAVEISRLLDKIRNSCRTESDCEDCTN